jgi:hypothetical protein
MIGEEAETTSAPKAEPRSGPSSLLGWFQSWLLGASHDSSGKVLLATILQEHSNLLHHSNHSSRKLNARAASTAASRGEVIGLAVDKPSCELLGYGTSVHVVLVELG